MAEKQTSEYGSWISSLTAEKLAEKGVRYGHMCVDQGKLYWLESRASEKGRGVLVCSDHSGNLVDVLGDDISVRSKVHEYGSGDFLVDGGVVYFADASDQCVYQFDIATNKLTQLTKIYGEECRYADFCISADKQFLVCVREQHKLTGVVNELVSIRLGPSKAYADVFVLASGFDFYSFPRFSPNGNRLVWTCWNQPDMPWDAAELWCADFHSSGRIDAQHRVAGGHGSNSQEAENSQSDFYSIYQPEWSEKGTLHFISDKSGWSNIYSCENGILNALTPIDREFAIPQWSLATSTYVIGEHGHIYAIYIQQGQQYLCHIDESNGQTNPIPLPFRDFGEHLIIDKHYLFFKGAGPAKEEAIYRFDLNTEELKQLSQIKPASLPPEELSIAKSISFDSDEQRECHAFYYPPKNSQFVGEKNSAPPLIVMSHGGPTAMTHSSLNMAIQFWTNRGFAVVDVNYAGSTGFGKKYRECLRGNWGIVDVQDCVAAAAYLVKQGLADEQKLLIRGGSAGGYTTLCALTFTNVFAAGMSRYGVADLESLASDSHKFEARYLDSVVGPYPHDKAKYIERSPIHHTDKLSCPILILQGEDDKVVPPNQAEMLVDALKQKSLAYAYRLYAGEGHGFRKSETIIDALNSELSFYRQVLDISSKESIHDIKVENLADPS